MAGDAARLLALEQAVGFSLPHDYRSFLLQHTEEADRPLQVVSSDPDHLEVRSIFELGNGADYLQADEVNRLTGDVLPAGMIAVADDSGGNLYLLDCGDGRGFGSVYWWDHEQELGEDRIELVCRTFSDFLASLVPDPED